MENNELEQKQEEQIISLFKKKHSVVQIEKETGYSTIFILMVLEKAQEEGILAIKEKIEEPVEEPTPLELTIKEYIAKGYNNKQIASALGFTYAKVYYAIHQMELKGFLTGTERKKQTATFSEEEKRIIEERKEALQKLKDQIKVLAEKRYSRREIAEELNIEYERVARLIQSMTNKGVLQKEDIKPSDRIPKKIVETVPKTHKNRVSSETKRRREKIALCKQSLHEKKYEEALLLLQSIEEEELTEEQRKNIRKMEQLLVGKIQKNSEKTERE